MQAHMIQHYLAMLQQQQQQQEQQKQQQQQLGAAAAAAGGMDYECSSLDSDSQQQQQQQQQFQMYFSQQPGQQFYSSSPSSSSSSSSAAAAAASSSSSAAAAAAAAALDSVAVLAQQYFGGEQPPPNEEPSLNYFNQHIHLFHNPNNNYSQHYAPGCQVPSKIPLAKKIVKEGYLMKRGEHIKNWRRRYFILFQDGTLFGYKVKPKIQKEYMQPLNNFCVKSTQAIKLSRPKPFTFVLRGLQHTYVVDRIFYVETEQERAAWVDAILTVSNALKPTGAASDTAATAADDDDCADPPEQPRKTVSITDFDLITVLGRGSFGKVVLSRERSTGCLYAIKILKKSVLIEKDEVCHTLSENRVLQTCRHPFLTQLKYSFQTKDFLFFVMEYVNGGELYYHLSSERVFSEARTRFYAAEIVTAIGYLHDMNIVYRDLKLENLLLDVDGHIRIADFGLCKEEMHYGTLTKTFCGTPEYLAPEILDENDYGRCVDWWGLGVVSYEMMCGRLPFFNKDHEILFELIMNEAARIPNHVSQMAQDFLLRLLIKDPSKRLGGSTLDAVEVMRHPFFSGIDWVKLTKKEIQPPWKPEVSNSTDARYIPEEFMSQSVQLTPPDSDSFMDAARRMDGTNFEKFSFYGSRTSLSSYMSSTSMPDL